MNRPELGTDTVMWPRVVIVAIAIAMAGACITMVHPASADSRPGADRELANEMIRSATLLRALGHLAVQEGEAEAVRTWGADVAARQDHILEQFAAPRDTHDLSPRDAMRVHDLAHWRSHWFDRRIVAAVIAVQSERLADIRVRLARDVNDADAAQRVRMIALGGSLEEEAAVSTALAMTTGVDPEADSANPFAEAQNVTETTQADFNVYETESERSIGFARIHTPLQPVGARTNHGD